LGTKPTLTTLGHEREADFKAGRDIREGGTALGYEARRRGSRFQGREGGNGGI